MNNPTDLSSEIPATPEQYASHEQQRTFRDSMNIDEWKEEKAREEVEDSDEDEDDSDIDVITNDNGFNDDNDILRYARENTDAREMSVNDEVSSEHPESPAYPLPGEDFPGLYLKPTVINNYRESIIREKEEEILSRITPDQFVDEEQYKTVVEHIKGEIGQMADNAVHMYKAALFEHHPQRQQIINLKSLIGLMGVELSDEAAEALAVIARDYTEKQTQSGKAQQAASRKAFPSQSFVENAGKQAPQGSSLSSEEKLILKNLNISPKAYRKYAHRKSL